MLEYIRTGGWVESDFYIVRLKKNYVTVREFLDELIKNHTDNCGEVQIEKRFETLGKFKYYYGKIVSDEVPDEIKDRPLPREFRASGGWGQMNYIIKFEY